MPEKALHSHPHEQVDYILKGRFELAMANETSVLEPGIVSVMPLKCLIAEGHYY